MTDKCRAVILDMDGLMLDTERPSFAFWSEAARRFGREIPREMIMRIIGINEAGIRAGFLGEYGTDFPYDEIRRETARLAAEKMEQDGIALRPGLITLLDCLRDRHIPYGVATSTSRKTALWKLEKAGIGDRFSLLVCGDEVKNGKPASDIFLAAAAGLGFAPRDCVGFEDSGPGLLGLSAAGIRPVFVKDIASPSPEALAVVWRQYRNLAEGVELFA
jgi:HAD superfamily hydrolase (TIGR01509 family)